MSQNQTKKLCCCSMGQAWGYPCEPCPQQNTREFTELCGNDVPGHIITDDQKMVDVDECSLMPTLCSNGICVNLPGTFECQCHRGFIEDITTHQCVDDNECIRNPCGGNAQCVNLQGAFECKCPDGYKHGSSFLDCVDINECVEQPNMCANGECKNLQGSFQCICNPGFTLTQSRDSCVDVDECARRLDVCNDGTCVNTIGSYKCHCNEGFKLSRTNNCVDVDECHMMPFLCRNGRCRNTIGSFLCECPSGYKVTDDGHNCKDIDECQEVPGTCPPPGKCQNIMGSFICTCPVGYELSPITNMCEDVDECQNPEHCENGICTNTDGGAFCTCPDGYVMDFHHSKCIDVRQEQCYDSFHNGQCTQSRGISVTQKECCCSRGKAWGRYCIQCPREDTIEYQKLCPEGPGRMDNGEDLNECMLMANICDGGDCVNTDGSYRCECPTGYVLDHTGHRCVDEDECRTNQHICGNGTCSNVVGGFECICNEGFAPGPMQTCEDINECHEIGNQCAFRCHNVPGSFRCICPYGYALAPDGRHCQDVDECVTPANNCKHQCKNLIGSFMCICPEGSEQVGFTDDCRDINECLTILGVCANGYCVNTKGSYRCDCFEGFEPSHDHKSCIDRRKEFCFRKLIHGRCSTHHREMIAVTKAECCCSMGEAWGNRCELCPQKYSPEYNDMCLDSGILPSGEDIDECATMPDLCRNGKCINTLGSYRCICNKGFKVTDDGLYCMDVNECELQPSPCKFNCQNTVGSFLCSCPAGYLLNPDGISCRDLDECETGQHICQHNCINTQGSYSCSCRPGFKQIGDDCQDINECHEDHTCPKPGKCINTVGSFRCLCPRGFKLDPSGKFCIDSDECLDDSKCPEGCQNLVGGYRCGCPEGYALHYYYNHCVDINECLNNPCSGSGTCINVPGSYRCGCPDGYQYDHNANICLQASSNCIGSPCQFGCIGDQPGISCGCPQGYRAIGQGHCIATISPGGYGPDLGNIPVYPLTGAKSSDDKIISTEGCFSCKLNGRNRRDTKQHKIFGSFYSIKNYTEIMNQYGDNTTPVNNSRRKQYIKIQIHLKQTRHKTKLLKLQPSVKKEMQYEIGKGNDNNTFQLIKHDGVWALHFRKRLREPAKFHLELHGNPINATESDIYEKPLKLKIHIIVTE